MGINIRHVEPKSYDHQK